MYSAVHIANIRLHAENESKFNEKCNTETKNVKSKQHTITHYNFYDIAKSTAIYTNERTHYRASNTYTIDELREKNEETNLFFSLLSTCFFFLSFSISCRITGSNMTFSLDEVKFCAKS